MGKYEALVAEKQKLEALFEVQKELVQYYIRDIKSSFDPAFNALDFLKKLTYQNSDNPILQSGINMLVDFLSHKLQGKHAGFIRTTVLPQMVKNYASHLLAGVADEMMERLASVFNAHQEEATES